MADISTDVMIVGTGPAGSATAALLASQGVNTFIIDRDRHVAWRAFAASDAAERDLSSALQHRLGH